MPQIGRWIYNAYVKPYVIIIPEKFVSVGFTTLGPVFSLNLAMAVEKKDVIVSNISVLIKQEDGSSHTLKWMGMREIFSEISDASGARQVVSKNQGAIAFKLNTITLSEKFVDFKEPAFQKSVDSLLNELMKLQSFLRQQNPNYHEQLLNSQQMHNLEQAIKTHFWWKAGKYSVIFSISSPKEVQLKHQVFNFSLSQDDIDQLKNNLNEIRMEIENAVKSDIPGYQAKQVKWVWKNPEFL